MRIRGLFWILTTLLLSVLAIITYHVFYTDSSYLFFFVEGIVILTIIYLCSIAALSNLLTSSETVWNC